MRLLHLQKQEGTGHLFIATFPEWGDVPFKLPSVTRSQQYAAALALAETPADHGTFYEYIYRECVVDQSISYDEDIPAGIVESISKLVLFLSGIGEKFLPYTEGLFDTFRDQTKDPITFMKRIVCSIFSGYTFESAGELDYQSLVEVYVNAEMVMIEAGLISEPYTFTTAEEQKNTKTHKPSLPTGPAGPINSFTDDSKFTKDGNIDLDALIADGKSMLKHENTAPAKGAYNLHDDPHYSARKEAIMNKFSR